MSSSSLSALIASTGLTGQYIARRACVSESLVCRYARGDVWTAHHRGPAATVIESVRSIGDTLIRLGADRSDVLLWMMRCGVAPADVSRQVAGSDISQAEPTLRNAIAAVPPERHGELLAMLREAVRS